MRNKFSAWILLLVLHMGMAWFLIAAVKLIISGGEVNGITGITSGWEAADSVVDDMLPARDKAVRLRTDISLAMGNEKIGDIYISEERLLREPDVLDETEVSRTAQYINSFYREHSIPTCITVFPAAAEIYTDCLPEYANVPSQLEAIDSFYEQTDAKIRTVDANHVLSTFKDDYIYYRTDSRCTVYGTYNVYRSLIRKLGYYPVSYDSWTISHVKNDMRGDLYQTCLYDGPTPDILDVYTCENSSEILSMRSFDGENWSDSSFYCAAALESENAAEFYMGKPVLLTSIETDVENGKKLLVFKDTFCDSMLPFFTQHYAYIDIVDMSCIDKPITEIVEPSDYQQVLIMCEADSINNSTYFSYMAE